MTKAARSQMLVQRGHHLLPGYGTHRKLLGTELARLGRKGCAGACEGMVGRPMLAQEEV